MRGSPIMVALLAIIMIVAMMAYTSEAGSVWTRDQMTPQSIIHRRTRDQCTMMGVAAKASADGSTMATHTNDCFDCDFRVALVKGKLHAAGSKRGVAPARFQYPRYSMHNHSSIHSLCRQSLD